MDTHCEDAFYSHTILGTVWGFRHLLLLVYVNHYVAALKVSSRTKASLVPDYSVLVIDSYLELVRLSILFATPSVNSELIVPLIPYKFTDL